MFFNKTMYPTSKLCIMSLTHYFVQTLTTLDLYNNQIGRQGVQYLANALQQNKVTYFQTSNCIISLLLHTDTPYTEPCSQSNQ